VVGSRVIEQQQPQQQPPAAAPGIQGTVPDIARRVRPAIVTINVMALSGAASGSGVIFRSDGYLITNDHVVEGASSLSVELASGKSYTGRVIGSDQETDIAVVKIDAGELPIAALGSTKNLEVGQLAIAIGSPLGLAGGPSVTVGVISALGRKVTVNRGGASGKDLLDMVQTDAPIAQGSSGGALVNGNGAVVGITTAVAVTGAEGFGFATPIDIAKRVAEQIITTGKVVHPLIGIQGHTISQDQAGQLGVDGGAEVTGIDPGTPAESAGLRPGDIIVSFDGQPLRSMDELIVGLRSHNPGDTVSLSVVRDGEHVAIRITLAGRSS
jgi:serine protease Do